MSPSPNYSECSSGKFRFSSHTSHLLVYYRIFVDDIAIPLGTHFDPDDEFLGRITAVPPPHTANTVKRSIAKLEKIEDLESATLYLLQFDQSPLDNDDTVNLTESGIIKDDPLTLNAKT